VSRGAPRVGISACLLGMAVRYDGGHKLEPWLRDTLGASVEWVPVCPEVEYGLPTPREPLLLVAGPAGPRLLASRSGVDHTAGMLAWAERRLDALAPLALCGFVFKSRSPSCGLGPAAGIFARAFAGRFPLLPIEEERGLAEPAARERFVERLCRTAG
jgi:uncharacterized protein YbbK (DUF523 family)